ncbi:tail protein [Escherichia phage PhaxI]|uniref:Tail spike TSP1/Gp66 N-terminal domain-containing protein n=1 Tax=Escherichia phage PhaxI TaxID=926589 RepID=G9IIM0_9CAUD|nr:tail protein [Escherichia phage PhaxI]AEW24389.1 hypothetical protein [Escherichia phage PhaxI]
MNELFSQGGKGSTGILTNKQAVARHFGVKQSEVVYFSIGAVLSGYKVIYDKVTQRAYSLPTDLGAGTTAVSLNTAGVLVHSGGNVDLGALAVTREEYVTLPGSFSTGVTVNTKNELVTFTDGRYRWDGALPKSVPASSTPEESGGIGVGAWVSVGATSLITDLTKYGPTIDQIAHRVTTIKSFEEFGAIGDGVTNDTASMLEALVWLEGIPFGKLVGRPGAKYLITNSLVMKFDGSYTQDVMSTRYLDFTGTVIVAGANNITCIRMSHDFCHVINPTVINPSNHTDVIAYAIAPENETQTTVRVSQQFCVMENPRARGVKIGIKFKPGPTVGGSNSGAYYHSIMNPNFERVDCGFFFERSESGDNNNTRIHIYDPHHATGNCSFWIESTDSLRVFGGHSENITQGTWPADVPCAVRVVKRVSSDTQVAGNLRFYGYFGELCTRGYQIDDNVGTYNNFFDWNWGIFVPNPNACSR